MIERFDEGIPLGEVSKEPYSLFTFLGLLYFARIGNGGKEGNYYSVELSNGWFTANIKVTIDKVMSEKEKEDFEYVFGVNVDKLINEFKEAGLIQDD